MIVNLKGAEPHDAFAGDIYFMDSVSFSVIEILCLKWNRSILW